MKQTTLLIACPGFQRRADTVAIDRSLENVTVIALGVGAEEKEMGRKFMGCAAQGERLRPSGGQVREDSG